MSTSVKERCLGIAMLPELLLFGFLASLLGLALPASAAPSDKSSVKTSEISVPRGPGSIEGQGDSLESPPNTAASFYGVKIALPLGPAGLQPSVWLAHHLGLSNSILGINRTMGFPCMTRQTDKGFLHYDSSDTFVFGGEELFPLNNAERDWRCENESAFQRFRQIESNADGLLDAWEVMDNDGTRHLFGQYRGTGNPARWSVIVHPGAPGGSSNPMANTYCWMLDTTIDHQGNRIDYEYASGNCVLYASWMVYSQLAAHKHEVTFAYEPRSDAFEDCRPTFSARIDKRLTGIIVWSGPALAYSLAYAYASGDLVVITAAEVAVRNGALYTGLSILKKITQQVCGGVADHNLPPLVFAYSTITPGSPVHASQLTHKTFDQDDYGHEILESEEDLVGGVADDERKTSTSYALGGEALTRWIISLPDTVSVTDENGTFVSRAKHYYDGSPFTGLAGRQVGARGLLYRTQEFKATTAAAVAHISSAPRQSHQPTPPPASRPTPAPNRLQPHTHCACPSLRILFPHHPFEPSALSS
jgi:hypothetical protein